MGSVRKRGEVWYAKWNDAAGRCHEERTSARTKAEARGLVVELEHKVERQRRGLEPIPADCRTTLAELCDMYVSKWCSPTCRERERCRLAKHIQAWPISALPLPAVTTAAAEDHLAALEAKGLGANSVKHVRAVGCSMYNRARKLGIWTGPNPFSDTQPRRIPHRVYDTLSADEALLVLANVPAAWQGFFAAALFLGLRKGECAGLSKRDVSMEQGTITIRVSYDHDTTKGKHADVLPIPPPLLPFIEAGLATKGPYLFPAPDGSMRTEQSDPQLILRRVLCRVGLVLGWDHVCRRCKAARKEAHTWRHPIHSTYSDNLLMLTLNRGGPVVWISEADAQRAGISDNDWVEAYNVNGALTARAVVSQRMREGTIFMYHAQEKIVNTPGSEITGQRGGIHNSVTRAIVKPTHMIGGYVQQAYGFNYYGTVGSNRDEFVIVRKMNEIDWLERPAKDSAAETRLEAAK